MVCGLFNSCSLLNLLIGDGSRRPGAGGADGRSKASALSPLASVAAVNVFSEVFASVCFVLCDLKKPGDLSC